MNAAEVRGRTALVTGASSGLGADFARILGARGCHLLLVARREERLQALRQEIVDRYGVDVIVIAMDLSVTGAPRALYDEVKARGKLVDILVNNAGYALYGQFVDISWERERNMLELDIITLTHMTKLFLRDMVAQNFGFILQVASNGAFQPTPTYATYSAAKAYVLSFGEAISYELRHTNVRCTVVAPGVTATEFLEVSGQRTTRYQRLAMMQSADVAAAGIEAMLKGRSSVVPGFANALAAWSTRLMPRRLAAAVAERTMTSW